MIVGFGFWDISQRVQEIKQQKEKLLSWWKFVFLSAKWQISGVSIKMAFQSAANASKWASEQNRRSKSVQPQQDRLHPQSWRAEDTFEL